jgi:hypothetical protein
MTYLTAEDLLAGSSIAHDVDVPPAVLAPSGEAGGRAPMRIRLRPLTVRDIQRVTKAARDEDALLSILMVKEALVEPALSFEQVHNLHAGLARFLVEELNRISGLRVEKNDLAEAVQAPLARACFVLAREFGWAPQEVGELTMGQILLYLEMIREDRGETGGA